jgi:hypothetical protein
MASLFSDLSIGSNKIGMVVWLAKMKTPEYPEGHEVVGIAIDVTGCIPVGAIAVETGLVDRVIRNSHKAISRQKNPSLHPALLTTGDMFTQKSRTTEPMRLSCRVCCSHCCDRNH